MKKTFIYLLLFSNMYVFGQSGNQLIKTHVFSNINLLNGVSNPVAGNIAYLSDINKMMYYDGSQWQEIAITSGSGTSGWGLNGNAGTDPFNNYIGTSDDVDLSIATNGVTRLIVTNQATTDHRVLFPKLFFFPSSSSQYSAVLGIDGNQGRLRVTAANDDTFNNSLAASLDLHGNNAESGYQGRLDLVAGSGASGTEQGINIYTGNTLRATFLGNGNFGINTNNPSSRFHINGNGFRYVDGNQANGRVLTSDANGNATWQAPPSGGGGGGSGNEWSLTGNAGTSAVSNFIGTTDNQALTFRINNNPVWRMTPDGKLVSLDSQENLAIGNSTTFNNNTTGDSNVALGTGALQTNSTGDDNTAIGWQALRDNLTGSENTAIGNWAMVSHQNGNRNVAVGRGAGLLGTAHSNSVIIGWNSGSQGNHIGSVVIGANANQASGDNVIVIGSDINNNGNNSARIGNIMTTSIGGSTSWSNLSDARFKENVKDNVIGLDFIMGLEPVTYNINAKAANLFEKGGRDTLDTTTEERYQEVYNITQIGFLAQEVEALADSLNFDFHGVDKPATDKNVYGLRYAEFVPSLVKAIQEQQQTIKKQQAVIENLITEVEELQE